MATQSGTYDFKGQKDAHDDAAKKATDYLTTVDSTGLMVHPSSDSTTGWKISSAIELLKSGVSYLKMWLDGSTPKVRIGKSDAANVLISSSSTKFHGSDGSTQLVEISTNNNRPMLRIGDSSHNGMIVISTNSSINDGVTTYYEIIDTQMVTNAANHESEVCLSATSQSGDVSLTVSTHDATAGDAHVIIGPEFADFGDLNIRTEGYVIGSYFGEIGARVTQDQSTAVSMANATYTNICSVSLDAGTWIIEANAQFASNATGRRIALLTTTSGGSGATDLRQTGVTANAVNGTVTYLHTGATKVYTATTTLYLVGYQNSGSALNTYGCITAVRIK